MSVEKITMVTPAGREVQVIASAKDQWVRQGWTVSKSQDKPQPASKQVTKPAARTRKTTTGSASKPSTRANRGAQSKTPARHDSA